MSLNHRLSPCFPTEPIILHLTRTTATYSWLYSSTRTACHDGEANIICSRSLTAADRPCDTTQRKRRIIVLAMLLLRLYLENTIFTMRTDHDSLQWIVNLSNSSEKSHVGVLESQNKRLTLSTAQQWNTKLQMQSCFYRRPEKTI